MNSAESILAHSWGVAVTPYIHSPVTRAVWWNHMDCKRHTLLSTRVCPKVGAGITSLVQTLGSDTGKRLDYISRILCFCSWLGSPKMRCWDCIFRLCLAREGTRRTSREGTVAPFPTLVPPAGSLHHRVSRTEDLLPPKDLDSPV